MFFNRYSLYIVFLMTTCVRVVVFFQRAEWRMQCQVLITKVSYKHKNSLQLTEMYLLIFTVDVSFGNKNKNTLDNIYIYIFSFLYYLSVHETAYGKVIQVY